MKNFNSVIRASIFFLIVALALSCNRGNPVTLPNTNSASNGNNSSPSDTLSGFHASGMTSPVAVTSRPQNQFEYAPDEVLAVLKSDLIPENFEGKPISTVRQTALAMLSRHGLFIKKIINTSWGTLYRLGIRDGSSVPDKVAELNAMPEIDYAEPNYIVTFDEVPALPNDPLYENQTDSDTDPRTSVFEQWGHMMHGASVVWNDSIGSPDVVVCVLDSGVNWDHQDLINIMWTNPDEIPDNDIDDDDNGYVDDIHGWDFGENDKDIKEYNNNYYYHGTACSGVVAAEQNNAIGCSGIAPGVRVMGCKISLEEWGAFISSVVEGVQYAVDNGASIISMSFGDTEYSFSMANTMQAAWNAGLVLCASSGNDDSNNVLYPSCYPGVIRVGGTCSFGPAWSYKKVDEVRISKSTGFWWGSNWGQGLEIMAFGDNWITTSGLGIDRYWNGKDDFFFRGTSNSCPLVAGAFALLKSFYPAQNNQWLRDRMKYTADDLDVPGYDDQTGYGRFDLIRAIYGVDRYESEEDSNGFVDLAPHDGGIFDSLNAQSDGDYIDTEDLYKFTADKEGILVADLDILTWGENLDMVIYNNPQMHFVDIVDSAVGPNHAETNHEGAIAYCQPGETYYIRIYPAALGDSSAYGLTIKIVDPEFMLTPINNDPGFIHIQRYGMLAGSLEFTTNYKLHISEIIASVSGTTPLSKITGIHLYRDSNRNFAKDDSDALVANGNFQSTNRAKFSGLNEELVCVESPQRFFITVDIAGITEDSDFNLVLSSYKDVSTHEGKSLPYNIFPMNLGPFYAGVDIDPPTWDTTEGIQLSAARYESALIYWNAASDPKTPPVKYNVYSTQTLPFDFATADVKENVSKWDGGDYDYMWSLGGLNNNELYYIAVRAEDQAGNEDDNSVYLDVTPTDQSLPYAPQIIGSLDTAGNAWEVKSDPANHRIFVADYNNGVLTIDVSDPTAPVQVSQYPGLLVSGVDFDGTNVFAAGANGLLILNPDGATGLESVAGVEFEYGLDVCVADGWAYVTNTQNKLLPVDVSDPENPVAYPTVQSGNVGYGIDEQNGYLYVSNNTKPVVFDLTDPSAPAYITDFGGNGAYEIDAVGDRLFVTYWSEHKFSIYDLTDPANPQFLADWKSNSGYNASDIVMFNGYLYFGTNYYFIETMDVSDTANIKEIGQVATNGPDGMDTDGQYIYSAENEDGIKVII